jgi:hypothetical protein
VIEVKRKLLIAALASCSWQYALGEGRIQSFKPGDYVEVRDGTSWQACVVSGNYRPESSDYSVTCGTKERVAPSGTAHIRLRKPTVDEIRIAAETNAALARLPRPGRGLASRYGTREPKVCASRKEPAGSALSPVQARRYFTCDAEVEGVAGLVLVTNVRVEVAPGRGFNYNTDSGHAGIDPQEIVYDIRGSYTHYDCRQAAAGESAFARTHNCSAFDEPAALGLCFKNTFGDWHCTMHDMHADIMNPKQHLLPPEGN